VKNRIPYDDARNRALIKYARERYRKTREVRRIAFELYAASIPCFERAQRGLCRSITASHKQMADAIQCDPHTVGSSLELLQQKGLIEYSRGERGPGTDRAASVVRRRTLGELLTGPASSTVTPVIWPLAEQLAARLSRPLVFNGRNITPRWDAKRTGRVYCAQVQNVPRVQQISAYLSGIAHDRVLAHLDFRQAEPSIINHLLAREGLSIAGWPEDPYQFIATVMGIPRDEAKRKLNAKAYVPSSKCAAVADFQPYGEKLRILIDWAENVDTLKRRIRIEAKARRPAYSVLTLGGRTIHALGGKGHPHNGKLLSWIAQGTVADAVVPACLEMLDLEPLKGWRLLSNVHDGLFLDASSETQAAEAEEILRRHAISASLKFLLIKKEVTHHPPNPAAME
jgi:hypothetical protein